MNIALYGRTFSQHRKEHIDAILNALEKVGCNCIVYEPYLNYLRNELKLKLTFNSFSSRHDLKGNADFVLSIGGEGTLLDTVSLIHDSLIPVIGVNLGRLGFFSGISLDDFSKTLEALKKHHYVLDPRSLLRLETGNNLFGENNIALNDFTIQNKQTSSMMTIDAYLNGVYLNSYWADGLIISTPTGSTGYSLSCGGPILIAQAKRFIFYPRAPPNPHSAPPILSYANTIFLRLTSRTTKRLPFLCHRA